jgi:hypothetical protein
VQYQDGERPVEMSFGYHRDVCIASLTAASRWFAKTNLFKEPTRRSFGGSPWWATLLSCGVE